MTTPIAVEDPPVELFAALADPMRWRLPERLASTARWIDATAPAWDRRLDALRRLAESA